MPKIIKQANYSAVIPFSARFEQAAEDTSPEKPVDAIQMAAFSKAKQIVDAANHYTEKLLADASARGKREAAELRQRSLEEGRAVGYADGKKAGYDAGYQEGVHQAREEGQDLRDALCAVMEKLAAEKAEILEHCTKDMTALAAEIARTIVGQECSLSEETLLRIVTHALEQYQEQEWLRLYVSPAMFEKFSQPEFQLAARFAAMAKNVKLLSNAQFNDTDCIVELPQGVIDTSVDAQINKVKSIITW